MTKRENRKLWSHYSSLEYSLFYIKWINAPASAVPNSYNEYGSHRVTLYEGNIA